MSASASASSLGLLPNELLDLILSELSTEPPSARKLHHPPSLELTQSRTKDLKHLAQSSSALLDFVRPWLFRHARLDLCEEPAFRSFVTNSGLNRYVTSIVVIGIDSPDHRADPRWWRSVIQYIDPVRFTVLAPPAFMGKTLGTPIMDGDSWAFDIPLQVLQLECDRSTDVPDSGSQSSLLPLRPWNSLSFNESSSLRAYNHYEYFQFQTPSVLGEWGGTRHVPLTSGQDLFVPQSLRGLTAFSYTAVFPFYNHVRLVLDALALMPNLRSLSMQLGPEEGNTITETEQRGSMDPSDPWMELETSYSLIGHAVKHDLHVLEVFSTRDFQLQAIRPELLAIVNEHLGNDSGWVHDGRGMWMRGGDHA
ncbi:hypothetical protein N7510_011271 [Penicillium lagena]|uniref:uncharacterized protein n=1 Tax=Penicillium lagena TaxID=94218 RepID=UPI0025410ECC|nr:uncharacterized protein N7510_011271 [Penicillium lagena]KAJ5601737.1 hypothetical protein N7510_011271 [Penicillium lagena]